MALFINKGNEGFASLLNSNYIDKSMLIEHVNGVLFTEARYMCVTRARRFGKSAAIKMLNAYYDKSCDSSSLFEGLNISKTKDYQRHLNQYPVIYIDMTDFITKYGDDNHLISYIKRDITSELCAEYPEVILAKDSDLMDYLVNIVNYTGKQFICLIDEWDALCREGYENLIDEYVDFLRRLFKGSNTERVFACAYMTGILPIKRYNTQSALNNFEEYTMLNPAGLASFFGFTEAEVKLLCQKGKMDEAEMKRWYDGYVIGNESSMYNPYAVSRAIRRNSFESYWTGTNTFESLKRYISMNYEGLKEDIVRLLADIPVKVNTLRFSNDMHQIECKDDVLTLLCHLGYLSFNRSTSQALIPNYEVKKEFETAISDTSWNEVNNALKQSDALLQHIFDAEEKLVAEIIEQIHEENTSILRYNDENSLACVLTLAFYTAKNNYSIVREYPSGKGFADIVLVPRHDTDSPAIVIELKWNVSADTAITQIKQQRYAGSLLHHTRNVILVGITYNKKTKKHVCLIENNYSLKAKHIIESSSSHPL